MEIKNKFSQIRKSILFHRNASSEKIKDGDRYRLDRFYTQDYFDIHPQWKEKVMKYFSSLAEQKIRVVHVDICGRTQAKRMGANKSYCFSLKRNILFTNSSYQEYFDGDIFNSSDFSKFITLIKKEEKTNTALITFEPVAGLQDYGPERKIDGAPDYKAITYAFLGKRLTNLINILRPGGYIYPERPFQFDADNFIDRFSRKKKGEYVLSVRIKKIVRKLKCRIEMNQTIGGVYYLIHKPEQK